LAVNINGDRGVEQVTCFNKSFKKEIVPFLQEFSI